MFSWRAADTCTPSEHTVSVTVDGQSFDGSSDTFVSLDAVRQYLTAASLPAYPSTQPRSPVSWTIPQKEGTALTLHGRDALLLTADTVIGGHQPYYTTSQLFGASMVTDNATLQYAVGVNGDDGETVLHYSAEPTVEAPEGVEKVWDAATGQLRLNYRYKENPQSITITPAADDNEAPLTLRLIDRTKAQTTWILDAAKSDGTTTPAAVEGVELARTATLDGSNLALTGSVSQASSATVIALAGVTTVTWNGATLGSITDSVANGETADPQEITPQTFTFVTARDDGESTVDYDDSQWTVADDTTSHQSEDYDGIVRYNNRDGNQQGHGTRGVVLDANHYGFHNGSVWYRAHYTASSDDPTIRLKTTASAGAPRQGKNPGFAQVWVNGQYAGSVPATDAGKWVSVSAPTGLVKAGEPAVLAVMVHILGLSLDWNNGAWGTKSQSKENRRLYDAELNAQGAVEWRIMGAGTDSAKDGNNPSGTIYNNGGLGGERAGWYAENVDDSNWTEAADLHADKPGIAWYRFKVTLNVPKDQDVAFRLDLQSEKFKTLQDHSQVAIFVNG